MRTCYSVCKDQSGFVKDLCIGIGVVFVGISEDMLLSLCQRIVKINNQKLKIGISEDMLMSM